MKKRTLIIFMIFMLFITLPSFGHDHDVPVVKTLEYSEKNLASKTIITKIQVIE